MHYGVYRSRTVSIAVAAMCYRARRQYPTSEQSCSQDRKFARDAVFCSRTPSIRAQPSLECPQNIALALEIASISVSVSELLLLLVCALWCLPKSYSVDTHGSGLRVPENIAAAAEITFISFSVTKL